MTEIAEAAKEGLLTLPKLRASFQTHFTENGTPVSQNEDRDKKAA